MTRASKSWKKNLIDKFNDCAPEIDFYEHCICGKQNYVQFYSSSHNSFGLLDIINYVVFGIIKDPLISKALFYESFINKYSTRTWVYFLRSNF